MEKSQQKNIYWRICIIIVILLTALGLSPWVIPKGVFKPSLLGMPYTLWIGILVCACLVMMTYIGSSVHPGNPDENKEL